MESRGLLNDTIVIFVASLIIALSFTYPARDAEQFVILFASFIAIFLINVGAKKFFAYNLETDINLKFWSIYHYGFKKRSHFKNPLTMIWMPILTSLLTIGRFIWMPIVEFDVSPRPERIAKRHGLYRYAEITEWHMALIATAGIFANIFFGVIAYFAGLEMFAQLSTIFVFWSIIPFGRLDGSKIFFGNKNLWFTLLIIISAILIWGLSIV